MNGRCSAADRYRQCEAFVSAQSSIHSRIREQIQLPVESITLCRHGGQDSKNRL